MKTCRRILLSVALQLITFGFLAQTVTISGLITDKDAGTVLPYAIVTLHAEADSALIAGAASDDNGRFSLSGIKPGNYYCEVAFIGYSIKRQSIYVGSLSPFLDIGSIELLGESNTLNDVVITDSQDAINSKMDKKTFTVSDNISQSGGSVLQAMQNLPGVTVQDGKVQLRGNDKVAVLVDGKQTAMTGFGNQTGLDNIPASAIERIEVINNPSAKYDANGNAGIINIIYKKGNQQGLNGKAGFSAGLGALWIKRENLPTIRPQFQNTPKVNPSLSLNYRKRKINIFLQSDYLYTETLNKNEFVTRTYDDGTIIRQQMKRNRATTFITSKAGIDWTMNDQNTLTISGLFGSERILDHGDEPFFNSDLTERTRLWQFLEDELKTTVVASAAYQHKFSQPGHVLDIGFNYTFHREDEKYFFDNILPDYSGKDSFKLLSDEHVADLNMDYVRPLKYGRVAAGIKFRRRDIPTNMQFFPGINSPLDTNAGGWAKYSETIPAAYGTYVLENQKNEAELGLRVEYVHLQYLVNEEHSTYKSNGYNYTQPFPNFRVARKLNDHNKISLFYNRRVDRPNEVDIRIFPKYDDAEIIKVGNPALRPQFTNTYELGYKKTWSKGYLYTALYHKRIDGTIARIAVTAPGSTLIYAIFQNADRSSNTGVEFMLSQDVKWCAVNLGINVYQNEIDAFTTESLYPITQTTYSAAQKIISGNAKLNTTFHLAKTLDVQLSANYLAPDIIPQGRIGSRFSLDAGIKKTVQKGKGEIFLNATDLLNTMVIRKDIQGVGFNYTSSDYYETQVVRVGYSYKF